MVAWGGALFLPTTLSCTELTSCHWLLELLVIKDLSIWTPILIGRPWVRDSIRYSHIHLEDSNSFPMHSNSTYVNYCNTEYYYCEWYCKFMRNTCPFPMWFVFFSLYLHSPFNCCKHYYKYLLEYLNSIQILIRVPMETRLCFFP